MTNRADDVVDAYPLFQGVDGGSIVPIPKDGGSTRIRPLLSECWRMGRYESCSRI